MNVNRLANETDRDHASYVFLTYMVLSSVVLQLIVRAVDTCAAYKPCILYTSRIQALQVGFVVFGLDLRGLRRVCICICAMCVHA